MPHWFWAKFFAAALECFSFEEGWWTFEDSTADVEVVGIAGGIELTLSVEMHVLTTAVVGGCLQDAVDRLVPCDEDAECAGLLVCDLDTQMCVDP